MSPFTAALPIMTGAMSAGPATVDGFLGPICNSSMRDARCCFRTMRSEQHFLSCRFHLSPIGGTTTGIIIFTGGTAILPAALTGTGIATMHAAPRIIV